jgi:hypothetical protein
LPQPCPLYVTSFPIVVWFSVLTKDLELLLSEIFLLLFFLLLIHRVVFLLRIPIAKYPPLTIVYVFLRQAWLPHFFPLYLHSWFFVICPFLSAYSIPMLQFLLVSWASDVKGVVCQQAFQ